MALIKINNRSSEDISVRGRRNIVQNGAFQIAQRGTSSTITGAATTIKTVDRFSTKFFGTEWTPQNDHHTEERVTDSPDGFLYSYKVTTDTATDMTNNLGSWIQHTFEGSHLLPLRKVDGGFAEFTVSFWVKSNKTGNVTVSFESSAATGGTYSTYVTINSTDTWEYKTVTIPEMNATTLGYNMGIDYRSTSSVASLKFGLASNGSWLVETDNQWNDKSTNRGVLSSQQTNFYSTVNDYIQFTGIQMEIGNTATPFEHRTISDDVRDCQRYFYKTYDLDVDPGTNNTRGAVSCRINAGVNNQANFQGRYPVPMRDQPTITTYSHIGTAGELSNCGANYSHASNATVGSMNYKGDMGFGGPTMSDTPSSNDIISGHIIAEADLN